MYGGSIASEMVHSKTFINNNKNCQSFPHLIFWLTFLDLIKNFLSRQAKLRKAVLCTVYLYCLYFGCIRPLGTTSARRRTHHRCHTPDWHRSGEHLRKNPHLLQIYFYFRSDQLLIHRLNQAAVSILELQRY